jgi:hypothetical protein
MIKIEIKYTDGVIIKREFEEVEKAVEWLKNNTNE